MMKSLFTTNTNTTNMDTTYPMTVESEEEMCIDCLGLSNNTKVRINSNEDSEILCNKCYRRYYQ